MVSGSGGEDETGKGRRRAATIRVNRRVLNFGTACKTYIINHPSRYFRLRQAVHRCEGCCHVKG